MPGIDTVRGRLTAFYVIALAAALLIVGGLIYVLLARALYTRIDDHLDALLGIAATSLANDLAEGQDVADAARSTAAELASSQQMLAIYDAAGSLLAERGRDDDLVLALPQPERVPAAETMLETVVEQDGDDRHRLAVRRIVVPPGVTFIAVGGSSLEAIDEELESLRTILGYLVPIALVIAGFGGWFVARQSLSPVVAMAERAGAMTAGNLAERLPAGNPRDELGRLAAAFNALLGRLEAAITQQRRFMADASHELRTPVATTRTAANVALQQAHREEGEYREALAIIEQQAVRLSRIVEDMFTLARADAGTYPVRPSPMYLDEVLAEVVRAARVLAAPRHVTVEHAAPPSAAFEGDEELIRRLLVNLVDNAVRHARTAVRVELREAPGGFTFSVRDDGPGIPAPVQPHIFERFYRADSSRSRRREPDGGAGLGLALARWVARTHGGDVTLAESSESGTVFTVQLRSA